MSRHSDRAKIRRRTPRAEVTEVEGQAARERDWFVLLTKPQRELVTAQVLDDRGLTAFCPVETRERRVFKRGRWERRPYKKPAYAKYVFLGVPQEWGLPWFEISDITFITGFLAMESERPVRLDADSVIDVMLASQTPLFETLKGEDWTPQGPCFDPGEWVQAHRGIMTGLSFEYMGREGLYAILRGEGAVSTVKVPLSDLERA